jgi:hypothetical protein
MKGYGTLMVVEFDLDASDHKMETGDGVSGRRRHRRGGPPWLAATKLVGVSESCPSDHRLMRGVHESKEEVGRVLAERKMKTGVDQ